MRGFSPTSDIQRNVYSTNWVAAMHQLAMRANEPKRKLRPLLVAGILGGLLVSTLGTLELGGVAEIGHQHTAPTLVKPRPTSEAEPTSKSACTAYDVKVALSTFQPSGNSEQFQVGPIALSDVQDLGGELIYDANCESGVTASTYQVTWAKTASGWSLKKISRQPIGQPGD
jgi:hypothetical protein